VKCKAAPFTMEGSHCFPNVASQSFSGEMKRCVQHGMIALIKEPYRINWKETVQETDGNLWHCKEASFSTLFNTDKNSKDLSSWIKNNGIMESIQVNNFVRGDL